jgi:hypothetical protein
LIYIIFTMGGKLLFSTNSDIYYFSFLVICFLHHIATIVVVLIGINSFRHRFVLSFILSIPHGMFLTLYTDTTVLLSRMIRYSVVPHTNAHTFQCFKTMWNSYNGRAVIYHLSDKIESQWAYSSRIYLLNFICWSEQSHVIWSTTCNDNMLD